VSEKDIKAVLDALKTALPKAGFMPALSKVYGKA
jgi:hypothetical protein